MEVCSTEGVQADATPFHSTPQTFRLDFQNIVASSNLSDGDATVRMLQKPRVLYGMIVASDGNSSHGTMRVVQLSQEDKPDGIIRTQKQKMVVEEQRQVTAGGAPAPQKRGEGRQVHRCVRPLSSFQTRSCEDAEAEQSSSAHVLKPLLYGRCYQIDGSLVSPGASTTDRADVNHGRWEAVGLRHREPGGDGAGRAAFSSRRTELGLWTSDLRGPVVFAASSFAHLQKQRTSHNCLKQAVTSSAQKKTTAYLQPCGVRSRDSGRVMVPPARRPTSCFAEQSRGLETGDHSQHTSATCPLRVSSPEPRKPSLLRWVAAASPEALLCPAGPRKPVICHHDRRLRSSPHGVGWDAVNGGMFSSLPGGRLLSKLSSSPPSRHLLWCMERKASQKRQWETSSLSPAVQEREKRGLLSNRSVCRGDVTDYSGVRCEAAGAPVQRPPCHQTQFWKLFLQGWCLCFIAACFSA
ncbi:hypothetical protein CB1_000594010 [Camelus ferus]|nr:hypothetical protein CB1_000594010 [Camelus ferus]